MALGDEIVSRPSSSGKSGKGSKRGSGKASKAIYGLSLNALLRSEDVSGVSLMFCKPSALVSLLGTFYLWFV